MRASIPNISDNNRKKYIKHNKKMTIKIIVAPARRGRCIFEMGRQTRKPPWCASQKLSGDSNSVWLLYLFCLLRRCIAFMCALGTAIVGYRPSIAAKSSASATQICTSAGQLHPYFKASSFSLLRPHKAGGKSNTHCKDV